MVRHAISNVERLIVSKNIQLGSRKKAGASDQALNSIVREIHALDKKRQRYKKLLIQRQLNK